MESVRHIEKQYRTLAFILLVTLLVIAMTAVLAVLHGLLLPAMSKGKSYFSTVSWSAVETGSHAQQKPQVIIDAGHGGEDGGASTETGVAEKDLNLAVSQKLGELFRIHGINVLYTRTEDVSLNVENIKGKHKLYDLKNRLKIAKEHPDAILISIHMNTFPVAKYSGLQVFYAKHNPYSKVLADAIQAENKRQLQPDNKRVAKAATSSIFLLDRCASPAILIECGFLSNPEEALKLQEASYQTQLALTIFEALINTGIEPKS